MPYEIEIYNEDKEIYRFPASTTPIKKVEQEKLFDNKPYKLRLLKDGKEDNSASFCINDVNLDPFKLNTFEGYYGWIKISASVPDFPKISTGYIYVTPKDEKVQAQIIKMIEYIVNRSKKINFPENINDLFGIGTDGMNTNFKTVDLINRIYEEYERNFRHFYNNSRAKLSEVKSVDSIEKLSGFSQETARFIVTQPQYLTETAEGPVKFTDKNFKERFFSPLKTLVSSNKKSFNIYENQLILGFLKHVIEWNKDSEDVLSFKDYFHLANEGKTFDFIKKDELQKKLRLAYDKYKSIFGNVDAISVDSLPAVTHIFKNVNHYQNLYKYMRMFFLGGIISPSEENAVRWYLDTSSKIYEYYVFLKLDEAIEKDGFERIAINQGDNILPKSFSYKKGAETKTLYYEPEIRFKRINSGLNLERFSPASLYYEDFQNGKIPLYTPDFVIKYIDGKGNEIYEIADAKFSDFNTVRNYYMPPSIFKYLASVEAINGAKISGLTLYYCKGDASETFEHPTIKEPDVKIVPLF